MVPHDWSSVYPGNRSRIGKCIDLRLTVFSSAKSHPGPGRLIVMPINSCPVHTIDRGIDWPFVINISRPLFMSNLCHVSTICYLHDWLVKFQMIDRGHDFIVLRPHEFDSPFQLEHLIFHTTYHKCCPWRMITQHNVSLWQWIHVSKLGSN